MMIQYCKSWECRRKFQLNYFGEEFDENKCTGCDNCRDKVQMKMNILYSMKENKIDLRD